MKWYHASPTRYKKGDLIHGKNCGWSFDKPVVFMTSSEIPHYTIFDIALKENWFVYQVKPLRKVKIGKCWDEAGCELVEVVNRIGNARGICNRGKLKKIKDGYKGDSSGSQVYWKGKRN